MAVETAVARGLYRDSVVLMHLADALRGLAGVRRAFALMGTPANLQMLAEAGIAVGGTRPGPSDLVLAVEAADPASAAAALASGRERLRAGAGPDEAAAPPPVRPRSLAEAAAQAETTGGLALISCPGGYAAAEAMKALRLGLDVMLFSDNVCLAEEISLKRAAAARGLLLMGPDCGGAIIGGIPLGFANRVRRGPVGIVAASGTGLQHVACRLDRLGSGVSHAIGVGGRDLSDEVGGMGARAAIDLLAADPATRTIVLVSKPAGPETARRLAEACGRSGKRAVICVPGADDRAPDIPGVLFAPTLEVAADAAVGRPSDPPPPLPDIPAGRRLVGLFSGGTLCAEARAIAAPVAGGAAALEDLGADVFTRARPHPMIDPSLRLARMRAAAADPSVRVILLDVVLGTGAHPDPGGALAPAIADCRAASPGLEIVAFVCGTEGDPQGLAAQEAKLAGAGAALAETNAGAVRRALDLLAGRR